MTSGPSDPTAVRAIAVTADDVVTALEARRRAGRPAVLRLTPPFHGRMRARLHVESEEGYDGTPAPIHLDPAALVEDVPAYPDPADTEDALRADPDSAYSVDRHREAHVAAVTAWREQVRDRIVEAVDLPTPAGTHRVAVAVLG